MKIGVKKDKYRKAVFVVVYSEKNNKIYYALLKRKLHWKGWEFPKGGIEKKETLLNAVKREIYEETGQKPLKIKKHNLSGKYKYSHEFRDRPGFIGQNYKLFSAKVNFKKIIVDKREHSGCKWFEFEKAIEKLHWENQKRCLKLVNNSLK